MNSLQQSLTANAIFSLLSGLAMILIHQPLANLFGLAESTAFWIIGIGLLLFSALVFFESRRQKPAAVLGIIIQDELWVLASLILLILNPFQISMEGNAMIATIATVVLIFAILQARALSKVDQLDEVGTKQLHFNRVIALSKPEAWKLISDIGNYHQVAPNIDQVRILEGKGEGSRRECSHGKDSWTETCTLWVEGEVYAFEVDTQAPDYPYPLSYLKGSWRAKELHDNQTDIQMTFDFRFKKSWQRVLIYPLMKGAFVKTAEELLDNWEMQASDL